MAAAVAIGLLVLFIGLEIILHIMAFLGVSPIQNTSGLYEPYALVYQNEEGHAYAQTNQYGWYAPEFFVDAANTNVAVSG